MSASSTKPEPSPVWRSPALAVAAALALRLVLLWLSHHGEDYSHPRYETVGLEAQLVALSLAAGRGFFGPYPAYQALTACIAPVYPFLLGAGDKLLHLHSFGSTVLAQLLNCVFSAVTCWPIFGIGERVFGKKIGLASAWVWVFLPYAVLLPLEWSWDQSLSALLLAVIVYATLRLEESPSSQALTGYGLLWAFTALVNPTVCILLPFLLGWWMIRRGPLDRTAFASAAQVLLLFALALLPWTVRNYYALDGFVFVKSNFGMELWLGNNPAVKEIYSADLHPAGNEGELFSLILNGEPNYNRNKQRQAIAYIEAHPRVFVHNVAARVADTWAATYDSRVEPWIVTLHLSRADVWFCAAFSILAFAGMIAGLRANWPEALPLALCLLVFPIPYYITHTALRYRHPIDPFLTIFAVYAVARLGSMFSALRRHPISV